MSDPLAAARGQRRGGAGVATARFRGHWPPVAGFGRNPPPTRDTTGGSGPTAPRNPGDEAAPGSPQTGEMICPQCQGSGRLQAGAACPNCGCTGRVVQIVGDA